MKSVSLIALMFAVCLFVGCAATPKNGSCPEEPLLSDHHFEWDDVHRHPLTRQQDRMVHNAELADMSVTDIHFLPNRAILNSNGTQRISRLAWIVERYGGTINLNLRQGDQQLHQQRMQVVGAYLIECGLSEEEISLAFAPPATPSMSAQEAIMIHNDTRYKPSGK